MSSISSRHLSKVTLSCQGVSDKPMNPLLLRVGNTLLGMGTKKNLKSVVAENLAALQKTRPDLSSSHKLAKASGVAQRTISNALLGKHDLRISTLEAIAKTFGVDPYQLLLAQYDHNLYRLLAAWGDTDDRGREMLTTVAEAGSKGRYARNAGVGKTSKALE
jgi:transcriptional regulator with XRE-family HTH domain